MTKMLDFMTGVYPMGTVGIMGGVPVVPTPFAKCMLEMMQYNYEHALASRQNLKIVWAHSSLHSSARNYLCSKAAGDFVVMLDTDHVHPADSITRLVRTMRQFDADVVTGVYHDKDHPHLPQLWGWDTEDQVFRKALTNTERKPHHIDAAGGGILLVSRRLLARMDDETEGGPFDIMQGVAEGASPFGEDLSFFVKIAMMDPLPRVMCLPTLISQHLVWKEIGPDEHLEAIKDMTFTRDEDAGASLATPVMHYGDISLETKVIEHQADEAQEDQGASSD